MFKSTFSKYLVAFILIILVSFIMLSGIITSIIQGYATEEAEKSLVSSSDSIASHLIDKNVEDIGEYFLIDTIVASVINLDKSLDVIIVNENWDIVLTTYGAEPDQKGNRTPIKGSLGKINPDYFTKKNAEKADEYLMHHGDLGGIAKEPSIACARAVTTGGVNRGYIIASSAAVNNDNLIGMTRRTVINSSAWVMLAAVIAVYFITERINHSLRNMTTAAKKFAKGDFSVRVTVSGEDEVSELGNAFNNMAESLEKIETMRSSFLAGVSHDLRTPMTTIAGFIEGITSGAIPPEKHDYYLGVIAAEVHRLSRLVSQLLDISRIESGDRKFTFENFDVAELARIVLISFEKNIDDKKLEVEFDTEQEYMPVYADSDAIHQVLYNLCHNAIKFANDGGKFRIKIAKSDNREVKISVFDDGQIIPKEEIGMIFERFYKSDKSRGLDRTGVGLGLYICKTIIKSHDQDIYVESTEGVGTEFSFTLKEGDLPKRKNS